MEKEEILRLKNKRIQRLKTFIKVYKENLQEFEEEIEMLDNLVIKEEI